MLHWGTIIRGMSRHAGDRHAHGVYAYGECEGPDAGPRVDTPRGPHME